MQQAAALWPLTILLAASADVATGISGCRFLLGVQDGAGRVETFDNRSKVPGLISEDSSRC